MFPFWDGGNPSGCIGALLRSEDDGQTWDDRTIFFRDSEGRYTAAEPRLCEMQPGRVVSLFWTTDHAGGKNLTNHMTVSHDGAATWSDAIDTGVAAQAPNLLYAGGDTLLAIQSHRGGQTGLFVRIVDFASDRWKTIEELDIYSKAPASHISEYKDMAVNLKFGQPSLLPMGDGEYLAAHWCVEDGVAKILTHRLRVKV